MDYEHIYMRLKMNSNRFDKSFRLHGDLTGAMCKW